MASLIAVREKFRQTAADLVRTRLISENFVKYSELLLQRTNRIAALNNVARRFDISDDRLLRCIDLMAIYAAIDFLGSVRPERYTSVLRAPSSKENRPAALMLAGGYGMRMSILTLEICKPSIIVPTSRGVRYLFDFSMISLIESGVRQFMIGTNFFHSEIERIVSSYPVSDARIITSVSKDEALRRANLLSDNSAIARVPTDTYMTKGVMSNMIKEYQDLSKAESKVLVLETPTTERESRLSTDAVDSYKDDKAKVRSILRHGAPGYSAAGKRKASIELCIIGRLALRDILRNRSEGRTERGEFIGGLNALARGRGRVVSLFNPRPNDCLGIDDIFGLEELVAHLNPTVPPREALLNLLDRDTG